MSERESMKPSSFAPKVALPALPDVCPLCPVSAFRSRQAPVFKDPLSSRTLDLGWTCPVCGRGVPANVAPDNLSMYLQPQLTSIVDYTMQEYGGLEPETQDAALDYCYALAEAFVEAHRARHGGLSIETGHFEGTGARILLRLLDALYKSPNALPWLVSIDPYGCKPYVERRTADDKVAVYEGDLYGDAAYAKARARLAPWTNHALYPVESYAILANFGTVWPYAQKEKKITFALLDAEHVVGAVMTEATYIMALDPDAVLVVDNCCNDPLIVPELEKKWRVDVIHESSAITKDGCAVPNLAVKVRAR